MSLVTRGGVIPDWLIERNIKITPFIAEQCEKGVVSFGLASYGYDCRVGYKFKVFTPVHCAAVDPKNLDPRAFVDVDLTPAHYPHLSDEEGYVCSKCREKLTHETARGPCPIGPSSKPLMIPPHSFALAETIEWFDIPRGVLAICIGKSTYARCGIMIPMTPLEPEWRGRVTVEIANTTPLPALIYPGEGIMQVIFLEGTADCRTSYNDKKGKYQDQTGLTLPFVK